MAPRPAAALLFFVGLLAIAGVSFAASAFDAGGSAPPPACTDHERLSGAAVQQAGNALVLQQGGIAITGDAAANAGSSAASGGSAASSQAIAAQANGQVAAD